MSVFGKSGKGSQLLHMLINKDKQTEQKGKKQVSNLETSHEAIRETLHLFSPFKLITFQI